MAGILINQNTLIVYYNKFLFVTYFIKLIGYMYVCTYVHMYVHVRPITHSMYIRTYMIVHTHIIRHALNIACKLTHYFIANYSIYIHVHQSISHT